MTLNDKEYHIIVSRIMFKTDYKLALRWLESQGFEVSQADYYRTLAVLDADARKRLYELAKNFEVIAADEVVKFQKIEAGLWEEYHKEKIPLNRARILRMITELQPYITSLYDQTKQVMQGKAVEQFKKDNILS